MKIRRLELFGFKSFKDRTIVSFDQPITAIVGSNGCGKSNVVDALYWVMGDMSPKHLRGHSMSDVIFSGSRDSAALDMAEVTLVMERDPSVDPELPPQFQGSLEIQITRRYYRSGDSEYFINKTACRLRDIQEFFMDTGVGAKAYSIIEQGAISRLVTQKPEERRSVIEEVAGIMKFKARKAETERKLENSRVNLTRVDDIVKDLQKQLSTLKRQAEKAEKFRAYSDELRALEVQMGCREWMDRSDARNKALLLSAELGQMRDSQETNLTETRAQLETLSLRLSELEEELATRRNATRTAELALKDLDTKIATAETRVHALEQRLDGDTKALEALELRRVELDESLGQLEGEIATVETEVLRLAGELEASTVRVDASKEKSESIREGVETTRRQLHTEELEQARVTQQIQSSQKSLGQLASREDDLKFKIESVVTELDLHQNERSATLSHLEAAFSTRTDLEQEKEGVDSRLAQLESDRGQLQVERDRIREELTVNRVRKEQLEALDANLDGVDAGGKALAKALRAQEGDAGRLLADSVRVPSLLEKAVEAVFGTHLQRVVAHDLGEVRQFQDILRASDDEKARTGRTSIWIPEITRSRLAAGGELDLNAIYLAPPTPVEIPGPDGLVSVTEVTRAPTVREHLINHAGVVGPLAELVKTEPGQENAEWLSLVKNVWVVRDRDAIEDISRTLGGLPLSFVTLDGDVLTREGYLDLAPLEIKPGTASVGLIQRKREISELTARVNELEGHLVAAQDRLDACVSSIGQEKDRFRELTARLAALNPDVEKHSLLLRQVEAQLARLTEKQTLLAQDLARIGEEKAEIDGRVAELTESLTIAETRRTETQARLDDAIAELQTSLNLQREAESAHQQLSADSRRQENRLGELQTQRAGALQERTLSSGRKEHLETGIASLRTELETLGADLSAVHESKVEQTSVLETARVGEEESQTAVVSQKSQLNSTQKNVEAIGNELQDILNRLRDIDQELAVNDVEAKNLRERLREQYQLAVDELDDAKLQELASPSDLEVLADFEAAKSRVQALRTKIENLGKINMVAVEEFEEISKRHEYLFIQRQDLADAISQLVDAIDRIDRESRHRFAEAFGAVNEAFKRTFPVLFGGGQAELRLTNPDNLLESGVEIVAQPPGKKLQSVTLLSGGEKALTAVSLIFGIFSIKPSPFCVLDEVDAPLDDANVARFNTQVRQMAETSQIIMITHHKKTMESCDALFGVTMEQPGISKVASAKLGELKNA